MTGGFIYPFNPPPPPYCFLPEKPFPPPPEMMFFLSHSTPILYLLTSPSPLGLWYCCFAWNLPITYNFSIFHSCFFPTFPVYFYILCINEQLARTKAVLRNRSRKRNRIILTQEEPEPYPCSRFRLRFRFLLQKKYQTKSTLTGHWPTHAGSWREKKQRSR